MENTFKPSLQEGWQDFDVSDLSLFGRPVTGIIHFEENDDYIIVGIDEKDPVFMLVSKHDKECNWDWLGGETFEEKCALRYEDVLRRTREVDFKGPERGCVSGRIYDRIIEYLEKKEKVSQPMKSATKPELRSETLDVLGIQNYQKAGCRLPSIPVFKSLQPFIPTGAKLVHFKMDLASYNLHLEVGFEAPRNPDDPYFLKVIADLKNREYVAYNYSWNGSIEDGLAIIKRPPSHMLDMDDIVDEPSFSSIYLYITTQLKPLCADGAAWNFVHDYIQSFRRAVDDFYGFDMTPTIPEPEYLLSAADENQQELTQSETTAEPQNTQTIHSTLAKQFECAPRNCIYKALRLSENTTFTEIQNFLNAVTEKWPWGDEGTMFTALTPGKTLTISPLGLVRLYSEEELHSLYVKLPADEI